MFLSSCSEDVNQLNATSSFQYPTTSLIAADIADDASIIALLSVNKLSVWSVATKQLIYQWDLLSFQEPQLYISLAKNKQYVATASKNKVSIFNIWTKTSVSTWEVDGFSSLSKITSLQFNENGEQLYIGLNEGSIVKVDLKRKTKSVFQVHSSNVNFIALSKHGQFALSASVDGSIVYFNTDTGNAIATIKAKTRITSLVLDSPSNQFFYSDALNTHQVVNLDNFTIVSSFNYFERFKYFRKGIFINNGAALFNSTPKNQIAVWDIKTGKQIQKGQISSLTFGSTVLDIAVTMNGNIVTISSDGVIETWNTKHLNHLNIF